ncbi:MAG: Asp-tRNA(Asn)/Glu-tRNA(Gln) amidotransferase subunit GatB, partial [Chloroflexi bacterium]|nr:Asp-tRNA(Asn)/Glu-tRNA(Gln) amidotransferase subunit GatB [Chloroflexota bacterium]
ADGGDKRVGITRVHQEEDVAKLFHRTSPEGETYSLVDVNRSGVPLMEIVSEPDMRSPEEARRYFMKLRNILQWLGVGSGNMEEGALRCDANVSVRLMGVKELSPKVEVKNMNSFRAVYRALEYEVERQIKVIESGGRIVQETRGWLDDRDMTVSQRSKEYAHDYRYFPEPDLPPLVFSRERVEEIRAKLPELPDARRDRFISQYGLSRYDADFLTSSRAYADYFEAAVEGAEPARLQARAKAVGNWVQGELMRLLNAKGMDIADSKVRPADLRQLLDLIDSGTLSGSMAKVVFEEMFETGKPAAPIVQERGFTQVSDEAFLAEVVNRVLEKNSQAVHDYYEGKEQALKFLVGQTMRESKGRANPALVNKVLQEKLAERR